MIIVKNKIVLFEGSKDECLNFIGFRIDKRGNIFFGNYMDSISYCLKNWTLEEIKKDFLRYRFFQLVKQSNFNIYE